MGNKTRVFYRGFIEVGGKFYTVSICQTEVETVDYMNQFCYRYRISGFNVQKILM